MAQSTDSAVEGVTQFTTQDTTGYRYIILLESEKLSVWLEDRCSKKQWQTGALKKEDYITAGNVFVDASARDYVACFKQCLDCPLDNKDDIQRTLTPLSGGKLQLELGLKIRLLRAARSVKYLFELQPIAVDRMDILESKLKDQQEELDKLRSRGVHLFIESDKWASSKLTWKEMNTDGFVLSDDKTSVLVLVPGLYAVGVLVNHSPSTNGILATGSIVLEVNGEVVQRAATGCAKYSTKYGSSTCSHETSTSLMSICPVGEGSKVRITCKETAEISGVPSYLTMARIGE